MEYLDIENPCRIYCRCKKHEICLEFTVSNGDTIDLDIVPCKKCLEEAVEKGSLEKARVLIEKQIKEKT